MRAARSGLLHPVFAGCCQRLQCPPGQPERSRRQPEQPLFQRLQGRPQKPFGPKSTEKGAARHIPPQHAPGAQGGGIALQPQQDSPHKGHIRQERRPSPDRKHRAHAAQHKTQQGADSRSQNNGPRGRGQSQSAPRSAQPARAPRADSARRSRSQPVKDEDPGLVLISRRPPQQKFTNFEEYMNAHGGATAPIEDHSDEV